MLKFSTLLFLVFVLSHQSGCSRRDDPIPPPITAADRALPIPVDMPPDAPVAPASATALTAGLSIAASATTLTLPPAVKVPIEDTLEPVAIDDASVPTDARSLGGKVKK